MKKITLPAFYEDLAEHYANTALTLEGDVKNPEKRFEELKYEFLKAAYEESLTPHMNPSPGVAEASFPVSISKEFVAREKKPGEGVVLYRQYKGAIIMLTSMMTRLTMGLSLVSKKESFEAGKGTSEEKGRNQIKRAVMASLFADLIWKVFQVDGKKISDMVDRQFSGMTYGQISKKEFRNNLSDAMAKAVDETFSGTDFTRVAITALNNVKLPGAEK